MEDNVKYLVHAFQNKQQTQYIHTLNVLSYDLSFLHYPKDFMIQVYQFMDHTTLIIEQLMHQASIKGSLLHHIPYVTLLQDSIEILIYLLHDDQKNAMEQLATMLLPLVYSMNRTNQSKFTEAMKQITNYHVILTQSIIDYDI